MRDTSSRLILPDERDDGIDRRGFLRCMAWAGAGALYVVQGGVLKSWAIGSPPDSGEAARGVLAFVQISDSHMGFDQPANTDVAATLQIQN